MTNSAMSSGHGTATIDKTRSPDHQIEWSRAAVTITHNTPTLPLHLLWHLPLAILSLTQWQPGMSWEHCPKGQATWPWTPWAPLPRAWLPPGSREDGIYRCGEHHGIPPSISGIFSESHLWWGSPREMSQKGEAHKGLRLLRGSQHLMAPGRPSPSTTAVSASR